MVFTPRRRDFCDEVLGCRGGRESLKILVVNANSSAPMTASIEQQLMLVKRPDTRLTVECIREAVSAIESARQAGQAIPYIIERIKRANQEEYDAAIIACFCDPRLEAAREESDILVMGIAETSFHIAAVLGHRFTVLTPLSSRIPSKEQDIRRFRMDSACASVRALDLSVSQTESDPELTKRRVNEEARAAIEQDGAKVVILGCAGIVGYAKQLEKDLGIVCRGRSNIGDAEGRGRVGGAGVSATANGNSTLRHLIGEVHEYRDPVGGADVAFTRDTRFIRTARESVRRADDEAVVLESSECRNIPDGLPIYRGRAHLQWGVIIKKLLGAMAPSSLEI